MGACREFCVSFAKYIVIFFNVLLLISAVSLIVTVAVYRSHARNLDVNSISTFVFILGVLIGVIAFFGCCGAIKENSSMLTMYAGILLVCFILQVVLTTLAFVASNQDQAIKNYTTSELELLYNSTGANSQTIIDNLQRDLKCCGLYGPNGAEVENSTDTVICSCCPQNCSVSICTTTNAYQTGCVSEVTEILLESLYVTGFVAIFFAVIELAGAIFAFCISGDINKERQRLP